MFLTLSVTVNIAWSSTPITRVKVRPTPLSKVMVMGELGRSTWPGAAVQTVRLSGRPGRLAPAQPKSANQACSAPSGRKSSTGGEFLSIVSAYLRRNRSSMRAPFRAIEPDSEGVSTTMRGLCALAASRDRRSGAGLPLASRVTPGWAAAWTWAAFLARASISARFCCGPRMKNWYPIRITNALTMNISVFLLSFCMERLTGNCGIGLLGRGGF